MVERLWFPLTLLSCLAASAETPPSAEQLIRAAVAVHAAQRDWKFTYREDDEGFQTGKKGQRAKQGEMTETRCVTATHPESGAVTEFTEEFTKIGEAWLPETLRARSDFKIGFTEHAYLELNIRRYDYKRFTVDSTLVTP
jgi:hypothetical protein